jgi:uncharacterized protein|uniref:membrane protein insertion efficiency factor YidD n=1 Tax=Orrella sp. TaxID=1921583 RepID=UPI0040483E7B
MKWVLIKTVRFYQFFLSPWMGNNCRFSPTCSNYAIEAINEWGSFKGSWLAVRRVFRCHPWAVGGEDPVPAKHFHKHKS